MSEKKNNSWPMTHNQSFIAAAVFVSFFVLWFLWAAVSDKFICWVGGKGNLSGWVQAFGSIGAIVCSAYLARYQFMKMVKAKRDAAGELLAEIFMSIKVIDESLNSLEESINKGFVSAQQIIKIKIFVDEIYMVLSSISLEDLSHEWSTSCIYARQFARLLKSILENAENLLVEYFKDVAFCSPRAVLNSSNPDGEEEFRHIYSEMIFMHMHAKAISEALVELGGKTLESKHAQSKINRGGDLNKIYKRFFEVVNKK